MFPLFLNVVRDNQNPALKFMKILSYKEMVMITPFVIKLVNRFGYEIQVPSRDIARILGNISFMSVIKYLGILEAHGYLTVEKPSRRNGNIYKLKKGRVNRLIADYNADIEIGKILANV